MAITTRALHADPSRRALAQRARLVAQLERSGGVDFATYVSWTPRELRHVACELLEEGVVVVDDRGAVRVA